MSRRVLCLLGDEPAHEAAVEELRRRLPETSVETAASVAEGRPLALDGEFDCVVTPVSLPDGSGLDLLDAVRADSPDLPVVFFAADGSERVASDAITAGVTDYVRSEGAEPYATLSESVAEAIDGYRTEASYRELFEATDDAVVVHDPDADEVVDVNEAVCELWSRSYGTTCDCTVEHLHAGSRPSSERSADEWVQRAVEEGSQRVEWLCETDDGTEFWADVRLEPAEVGGRTKVIAHIRDITEGKRRQRRLESLERAVEHAGHSIYITDTDGTIEYVNSAFEELTGYRADEMVGHTPAMLKSGEHDEEFYRDLWRTILAGEVWQNEIVNRRKDGTRYVVNQTIAPITDENGDIYRFVAVNADITEQKRRERQLERLYDAATEWLTADSPAEVCTSVSDQLTGIFEFDLHGLYLYDEAGERLEPAVTSSIADSELGESPVFERGEGVAWTVFETGTPQYHADITDAEDVYNPSTPIRSELVLPLGQHGVLLVGSKRRDAFDEADVSIAKVLASLVTEVLNRIAREEELREQNSRLKEFADVVSHDLRNPLSVAMGHLDLTMESGDLSHLTEVQSAHDRMEEIIENLLWLAREGRGIGETRPVDLERIAENAWDHVDTADARLETTGDGLVVADPDRLAQLFENLFRNAVEHGGSAVTVRVGLLDGGFYVEDTGPGIPEADREKVFETGVTMTEDGTGYGLSIVETIVDAHGWTVDIVEGDAGGARFEIRGLERR